MASIPLPALNIHPPQAPADPLEQYGKLMQMQQMGLQMQRERAQNQMIQQKAQDQQKVLGFLSQNPGSSYADAAKALHGQIGLDTHASLMEEDAKIQETLGKADETKFKNFQNQQSAYQGIYNNVMNMPDVQVQQNWGQIAQAINSVPGGTLKLDPSQPKSKAELQQFGPLLALNQNYLAVETEKRLKKAQLGTAESESVIKGAEAGVIQGGGLPDNLAKEKYEGILTRLQNKQPVSATEINWARGHEFSERKTTSTSDSLGVTSTNTSGPSGLAAAMGGKLGGGGSGQNVKGELVDLIGQYRVNPAQLQRMQLKHPDILALVAQKYPDWDQTNYEAKQKAMLSFTSGPYSRQINATNIALSHIGVLDGAIDALKNGDLRVMNKFANAVGVQTGDSAVTVFRTIVHKLAPELAQAYIQGGGGEGERQNIEKDYDPSLGAGQLKNNLGMTAHLLVPNIQTIENQYKTAVGRDDFQQRFLIPSAKATLAKFGGQGGSAAQGGGGITVKDPRGVVHNFPNQAAADAFKKAAGIQ